MTVTISPLASNVLGDFAQIQSLNNEGVAVGSEALAAIWQGGTVAWLSMNNAGSINDLGQIAGTDWNNIAGTSSAELYQNGKATALPTLGGVVTPYTESASGINDAGQVVGQSAAPGGLIVACLWQNGVATNLGTLPGGAVANTGYAFNSSAAAINASGQIAGTSLTTGNVDHAFIWQNGVMTDLGTFAAGDSSFATAINASGVVVGYDEPTSGQSRAFSWQNGKLTNLGTLPGDDYSTAEAINSQGIIVGQAGPYATPSSNHAVMWVNGKIIDLNTLLAPNSGWYLQTADAINDNGEIVGRGWQGTVPNVPASTGDDTYVLMLNGNSVVIGSTVQSVLQTGVITPSVVLDSGANVLAGLDGLEALTENGLLDSVTLTDATAPRWTLTSTQFGNDFNVLTVLQSPVSLTVTGSVTAFEAANLPATVSVTAPLAVADSSANISSNFGGLESAVAAGKVGTITIAEPYSGTVSVISITMAQYDNSAATLAHVSGQYSLAINDTAAELSANFDQLQSLAAAGKITDIEFSDYQTTTPSTLSLTSAQFANDQTALNDITYDAFNVAITPSSANATINASGYGATVVLPGASTLYTVKSAGNGVGFTLSGNGVNDTISNVTALQFSDHTLFVASQTPAAAGGVSSFQVTSLYAAVLARQPDVGGLASYEAYAAANPSVGIVTYGEWFLKSAEYTGNIAHNYAQTAAGDAQFITDTYVNLLHRAPESGAVAFYQANVINPMLSGLTAGSAAYTQAELVAHATVLTYFSQSSEFQGDVAVTAQHPADGTHWLLLI